MKENFNNYLTNAYWMYVQYGVQKYFCIRKSAYLNECVSIWEFDNQVQVSDVFDYVDEYQRTLRYNEDNGTMYELPDLIYQTESAEETRMVLDALKIKNYDVKIQELLELVKEEKTLSLVDNK